MPEKTTATGRTYRIDGRKFIWPADVDEGDEPFDVEIPLRIKMRVLRAFNGQELTAENMMGMLEAIIPNQSDQLDELDVNDFQEMFTTWQFEYELLNGASLGESSGSSGNSTSTGGPSSTTGDTASTSESASGASPSPGEKLSV